MPMISSPSHNKPFNLDLLKLVFEDTSYLFKEWSASVEDDALRRSSNVLRNLLVYDLLGQAAREIGFSEMRILAPDFNSSAVEVPPGGFFQLGGAISKSITAYHIQFMPGVAEDPAATEKRSKAIGHPDAKRPLKLGAYLKQPSFIFSDGSTIDHGDVITYVANKLGSAHFDQRRDLAKIIDQKYAALDTIRATWEVAERNAVYYELLSIGQCVVTSNDIVKLRKQLKSILAKY